MSEMPSPLRYDFLKFVSLKAMYTRSSTVTVAAAAAAVWLLWRQGQAMWKQRKTVLKLTYLDMGGSAEPIRMALRYGGLSFEDERIGYSELRHRRRHGNLGPLAVVPVLEVCTDAGKRVLYNQSNAILRFVGQKVGLYPDGGLNQLDVDQVLEAVAEINSRLLPAWYKAACARSMKTGEPGVLLTTSQLEELNTFLNDDILPSKLGLLEAALSRKKIETNGCSWFLGRELSIADLSCATLVHELMTTQGPPSIRPSVLNFCPELRKHSAMVYALPSMKGAIRADEEICEAWYNT